MNSIKEKNIIVDANSSSDSEPLLQDLTPSQQQILSVTRDEIRAIYKTDVKTLTRGKATIPLKGIDVPFHSSFLKPGVSSFRNVLRHHINQDTLDLDKLSGRYIPNLTAKPFEISEESFKEVAALTGSPLLKKVADDVCSPFDFLALDAFTDINLNSGRHTHRGKNPFRIFTEIVKLERKGFVLRSLLASIGGWIQLSCWLWMVHFI